MFIFWQLVVIFKVYNETRVGVQGGTLDVIRQTEVKVAKSVMWSDSGRSSD